ncbi:MAG: site-2 protease family protein [Patescibacteria group bacterium]
MILIWILAFAITITIHEAAHAWTADRLGDPTARLLGRLSLNPIVHADLYGSVLVPLLLIFIGSPFVFGWAKPVPIDPYNLQNPRKDSALIALAGPLVNILLATLLAILFRVGIQNEFILILLRLNVILAVFNLVPIHPLDGGKVLVGILPDHEGRQVDLFLGRYGMILLFMLIFPIFGGTSLITSIISPIINTIFNLLIPMN